MMAKQSIQDEILHFYDRLEGDDHSRFRSWEYCYQYFQSEEIDLDTACLHLGFYLASWGMYRGSSFLLQKDFFVHKPAVKEILKTEYKPLLKADTQTFLGVGSEQNIDLLFDLISNIKNSYKGIGDTHKKKANVTDTLVTKILLGTLGCIPAYDRFFISGMKSQGLTYSSLRKLNFEKMIQFCNDNVQEFEQAQKAVSSRFEYPMMKLVDMYFWRLGEKAGYSNG